MIVIDVPALALTIVTLAAALYVAKRIEEVVVTIRRGVVKRRLREINALHDKALDEIHTDFEFWWTTELSQKVRDALLAEIPPDHLMMMDEGDKERVIESSVLNTHGVALHLAVHARMGDRQKVLMARLPRDVREQVEAFNVEHEASLEADRHIFLRIGFDLQEFERFFSAS